MVWYMAYRCHMEMCRRVAPPTAISADAFSTPNTTATTVTTAPGSDTSGHAAGPRRDLRGMQRAALEVGES